MGTTGQLSPTGRGQNWCGEGAWCKDISQQPDTPALLKETGGLGLPWGFGTSVGEASCCPVLRTTRHLHPKYITASQETHGYNALKGVEEIKSRIDVMVNVLQGFACSLVVFHIRTRPRKIQDNMQMHKAALKKTEKEVKSIYKVKRKEAIEKG